MHKQEISDYDTHSSAFGWCHLDNFTIPKVDLEEEVSYFCRVFILYGPKEVSLHVDVNMMSKSKWNTVANGLECSAC